MSKYTIAGLVSWLFSVLILLFQSISSLMGTEKITFKNISLASVIGKEHFNWINSLSWVSVQNSLNHIVTMPLFLLLFFIGMLLFLLHMLLSKH
jgi:hypothetical protein